jgi:pimeloyl-ACP methyl ester carboxylesterase
MKRRVNGVDLYIKSRGESGPPVVMVDGSWGDHHNWDAAAALLAHNCRVTTYDRRGHGASERLDAQGSIREDVRQFVETVGLGAGMWELLSPVGGPLLMSQGDQRPPFFGAILEQIAGALPHAQRHVFGGEGHVPHVTHPVDYALVVGNFITE